MFRNLARQLFAELKSRAGDVGSVLTILLFGLLVFGEILHADEALVFQQGEKVLEFGDSGVHLSGWDLVIGSGPRGKIDVTSRGASPVNRVRLAPRRSNEAAGQPLGISRRLDAGPYRGKDLYVSATSAAAGGATAIVYVAAVGITGLLADVELSHGSEEAGWETREDVLTVPPNAIAIVVTCSVLGASGDVYFEPIQLATIRYWPHAIESFQVLSRAVAE